MAVPNSVDQGRQDLVDAASCVMCMVCGTKPCWLLSSAAQVVLRQSLVLDDDIVGGVEYVRYLAKLHDCIMRHQQAAADAYGLNVSPTATELAERTLQEFRSFERNMLEKKIELNGKREDEENTPD